MDVVSDAGPRPLSIFLRVWLVVAVVNQFLLFGRIACETHVARVSLSVEKTVQQRRGQESQRFQNFCLVLLIFD